MQFLSTKAGSIDPGQPWQAIRTRSKHEKIAATGLASKGYEQFVPYYRSRRRWSDRTIVLDQPLFPGYVFCRFDPARRLPIVTTPGVISIVGFGEKPALVPDDEVCALKKVTVSGLGVETCVSPKTGERVRISAGVLQGLQGILLRQKSDWRLVVSVDLLQRAVSVEIDRDWVERD